MSLSLSVYNYNEFGKYNTVRFGNRLW